MSSTRRSFSAQQKSKVALAALREDNTINEVAAAHNVHPSQVRAWRKQLLEGVPGLFDDKRRVSSEDNERRESELFEQIGRLKMELEWLRKQVCL